MATSKPRITVTFEPRTYEVLSRMAASQRASMSQMVAELVDLAVPSFERVLAVVERAATASEEVKQGMRAALDRADREMVPKLEAAARQGDMFLAAMARAEGDAPALPATLSPAAAKKRPRGASAVGAGVSTPVPVTRGSGAVAGGTRRGEKAPPKARQAAAAGTRKGGRRG